MGPTSLITADCGGSDGARVLLWKRELQALADELELAITVCHLPLGTSKWNKIEHRLFSFITQNWRRKPLVGYQAIVQLIAATTTRTGLNVKSAIDTATYPAGVKVSNSEMATINIESHEFHGEGTTPFERTGNEASVIYQQADRVVNWLPTSRLTLMCVCMWVDSVARRSLKGDARVIAIVGRSNSTVGS